MGNLGNLEEDFFTCQESTRNFAANLGPNSEKCWEFRFKFRVFFGNFFQQNGDVNNV